jgi:hypothetical protein
MELQNELEEEAEAQSVIKRLDDASFIDDIEMRSESSDETRSKVASKYNSDLGRAVVERKAAPKGRKVCLLATSSWSYEHDYSPILFNSKRSQSEERCKQLQTK